MKDIDRILKALEEQGWRIEKGNGHIKAFPADKTRPMVTMPSTPGGPRWMPNVISQLRRSGFVWPWPPQRKG